MIGKQFISQLEQRHFAFEVMDAKLSVIEHAKHRTERTRIKMIRKLRYFRRRNVSWSKVYEPSSVLDGCFGGGKIYCRKAISLL